MRTFKSRHKAPFSCCQICLMLSQSFLVHPLHSRSSIEATLPGAKRALWNNRPKPQCNRFTNCASYKSTSASSPSDDASPTPSIYTGTPWGPYRPWLFIFTRLQGLHRARGVRCFVVQAAGEPAEAAQEAQAAKGRWQQNRQRTKDQQLSFGLEWHGGLKRPEKELEQKYGCTSKELNLVSANSKSFEPNLKLNWKASLKALLFAKFPKDFQKSWLLSRLASRKLRTTKYQGPRLLAARIRWTSSSVGKRSRRMGKGSRMTWHDVKQKEEKKSLTSWTHPAWSPQWLAPGTSFAAD